MTRWVPYPLLTAGFLVLWLLLQESVSPGALLLGAILGIIGAAMLAVLNQPRTRLRRLTSVPALLWMVFVEIVRSNNAVARIILGLDRSPTRRSAFVPVPLEMRSPAGLAALACVLTATPGTVWVDYDAESGIMLVHVLDLIDEDAWVAIVKDKWERRLMEIFE